MASLQRRVWCGVLSLRCFVEKLPLFQFQCEAIVLLALVGSSVGVVGTGKTPQNHADGEILEFLFYVVPLSGIIVQPYRHRLQTAYENLV